MWTRRTLRLTTMGAATAHFGLYFTPYQIKRFLKKDLGRYDG